MDEIYLFDCDGPLINDNTWFFFRYAIDHLNLPWCYETYCRTGHWEEATKQPADQINQMYVKFLRDEEHFPGHKPTPGAEKVVSRILEKQRVVSTSRNYNLKADTEGFLLEHYGNFSDLRFQQYDKVASLNGCYRIFCFVEDNVWEVQRAFDLGISTILFPTRGFKHNNGMPSEVLLDAEAHIHPDMSDIEWEAVCRTAWNEIEFHLGLDATA